jgi:hypothetical protein
MALKHFVCLVGMGLLTTHQIVHAAMLYSIDTLGLYDSLHTRADGYQYNHAQELNQAGQVSGYAQRYNGGSVDLGRSEWLYNGSTTLNIGLTGTEHTRNDGYQYNLAEKLNEAGQVAGNADRYNGGSTDLGNSAWLYDGSSTLNIGLTGSEHTRDDGYQNNRASRLNEAGQVLGSAYRYNGSESWGRSTWFYDGATTLNIGLTDQEHTRDDGYQSSTWQQLNEAGQVIGGSTRYQESNLSGGSAWLYDGSATRNIGLTDDEHTSDNGYRYSFAAGLNETGQVIGLASRYDGSTELGQSAWLYDGSITSNIGLTDREHTRDDGYQFNRLVRTGSGNYAINEAGQVIGDAKRYNGGSTELGRSAWLYNGSRTLNIGLTGGEYTRNDGYHYSVASELNEAGQVVGYSTRYSGLLYMGQSAWLYDGSNTRNIGLTDSEHTRDDGYQYSSERRFNEAGRVIGYAERYNLGSTSLGQSAWLYNGSETLNIGLTGSEYTRDDGFQFSAAYLLNEAGQVAGFTDRFNGGSVDLGHSVWFYDDATGMTYFMDFSVRPSDGYAVSAAGFLGEDGLMLGSYELYDQIDSSTLGIRAFGFTVEDGFFDLGLQIDGGLDTFDWDHLATAYYANDFGQIIGGGLLDGQIDGQAAYLLTPNAVVPVPAAAWLFGSGLIGLIGIARRRKA